MDFEDDLEEIDDPDNYGWVSYLTIEELVKGSGTLAEYCEVSLILGPRDQNHERPSGQLQLAAIEPDGGLLLALVRRHFMLPSDTLEEVLVSKLPEALVATRWPGALDVELSAPRASRYTRA